MFNACACECIFEDKNKFTRTSLRMHQHPYYVILINHKN